MAGQLKGLQILFYEWIGCFEIFHKDRMFGVVRLAISLVLIIASVAQGQAQQWQWVSDIVGNRVRVTSVVADGESVYCTGIFVNTVSFGQVQTDSEGGEDAFVAKLGYDGSFQWVHFLSGPMLESLNRVRIDANGDVWVTGGKGIDAVFAGQATGEGFFIAAKINADGEVIWVAESSQYGGPGVDIAFDSHSNGFICGWHSKFMQGGQFYGLNDIFVLKVSTFGAVEWARRAGGSGNDQPYGIEVVRDTSVFVVGQVADPDVYFGNSLISAQSHGNAFIAEYSSSGNFKNITFSNFAPGYEIFTDVVHRSLDDKLYVCGFVSGTFGFPDVGPALTTGNGDQDYILLRMNTDRVADTMLVLGVAALGCNDVFNEIALSEEFIWIAGQSSCDGTIGGYPLNVEQGSVRTPTLFQFDFTLGLAGLYSVPNQTRGFASSVSCNAGDVFLGGMLGISSDFSGLAYDNVTDSLGFVAKLGHGVVTQISHMPEVVEMRIIPNPVIDFLHVSLPDGQIKLAELTDVLGRSHSLLTNLSRNNSFDLTNIPSGIYTLTVSTDEGVFHEQILKQ